ncbi:MAG TPA: RNA polymerase sigma factor RpoD/SigA [Gemmatimonadaceae bacterium]|nr:RNA polymerase sigma factor RpoD/SigA [Gemmatimonadaceae bacterium]
MAANHRSTDRAHPADSLTIYLREIASYPLLERAEESELARRIRGGDDAALDALVCANLRFVVSVAKLYQHQGVALSDLIDEGNLGLIHAAKRFDESKGVRFISYAVWWIRQAIAQALNGQRAVVRIPLARENARRRLQHHATVLGQQLGREPTDREIASRLAVSVREVESALRVASRDVSLDGDESAEDGPSLLERLADERVPSPDERVVEQSLAEAVSELLACLRDREATVVRLHFGIDGGEPQTLERIGATLGVTRERVRQIRERALMRMRKACPADGRIAFDR